MPDDAPKLEKKIVVLHRDDYNRARSMVPELLTDPFTTVVPVPLRPPLSDDPTLQSIEDVLQPGTLLIRNRWDADTYVEAALAYERISAAKFNLVAEVCQMLGAARLEVREIREVTEDGQVGAAIRFQAGAVTGSVHGAGESLRRVAQSMRALWEWRGGEPAADAAAAHARQEGIHDDPAIRTLIRQRSFPQNELEEHSLELDISSEALREVHAAVHVASVLRKLGPSFDGAFQAVTKDARRLILTMRVVFPPTGHHPIR
ncbi:hypothetical protein ACFHYQ_23075 [Sphaerimonospora cavernae]|uniref:Uncharacterized protein n=1 Tax=Sphaerimonospora cavernae TaxID=1740611 RepID=A0ABV6UAJ0_9ACTN